MPCRAIRLSAVLSTLMAAAIALASVALADVARAAPKLPELTGRVVDGAQLLSAAERASLDSELAAIEAKSTDQVVVVTVPSLQGYPIEDFGHALGQKWAIGQKGKDNGIIVLVAPGERKVRFEVGRGLEPLLPDGKAGTIIRNTVLPAFRRGDFAGGIKAGVADIRAVLEGDKAELDQRSKRPPPPVDHTAAIVVAIWLAIVLLVIYAQINAARQTARVGGPQSRFEQRRDARRSNRRRRQFGDDRFPDIVVIPGGSGDWGGNWGGGGFSGGGGSFGGGGASGDW